MVWLTGRVWLRNCTTLSHNILNSYDFKFEPEIHLRSGMHIIIKIIVKTSSNLRPNYLRVKKIVVSFQN